MTPQEIEQIINTLVEKLGPIGGQVWSIYVRQVYVGVITDVVLGILSLLAGVGFLLGARWCLKSYSRARATDPHGYGVGESQCIAAILCTILGPLVIIAGTVALTTLFRLMNPQYYAIQMLLGR